MENVRRERAAVHWPVPEERMCRVAGRCHRTVVKGLGENNVHSGILEVPDQHRSESDSQHLTGVKSEDLFQGRREVSIAHNGQKYILKITRSGKLILNK